jgi:hypothetical protein
MDGKSKFGPAAPVSINDVVGLRQQQLRHREIEGHSVFLVDSQVELCWLFDR